MDCLAQTVDSGRSTLCARQSMDCPRSTVCAEHIFTRCAYAQGRVKRLSPSIYIYMWICVCVGKKTRLFAVLPLENRHEIALYRSASQFIFFERCLESRKSLLSSAMAMGF